MWVRTPIIPQATMNADNISRIGAFIAAELGDAVSRWELCAFNNLCRDKYLRLGLDWQFKDTALIEADMMDEIAKIARRSGVDPKIVRWSGSTALKEQNIQEA